MAMQTQYKTIGEIKSTNTMRFQIDTNGLSIADALLSSHTQGAPVVNRRGEYVGFVSEFDLLKAAEAGRDLRSLRAADLMSSARHTVDDETPVHEAVRYMEKHHVTNLPVVRQRTLLTTVTRHDLLRVLLGFGLGIEQ